jgi:hypothetical protein
MKMDCGWPNDLKPGLSGFNAEIAVLPYTKIGLAFLFSGGLIDGLTFYLPVGDKTSSRGRSRSRRKDIALSLDRRDAYPRRSSAHRV